MSRRKPDQGECGERPSGLVRSARRCCARSGQRHNDASIGFRSFVLRIAKFATLSALALVCCGLEISRAQVSDAEKASYADALAYCRGNVARPMALRSDKRVLCLDGPIYAVNDIWLAGGLAEGGVFVVRGDSGDIATTLMLADMLLTRQATVVINDYCVGICANYLFIASVKTFVPKDAVVAWINHATGPNNCIRFWETPNHGEARLQEAPCDLDSLDSDTRELIRLKSLFYKGRVLSFQEPPESIAVRRILKNKFDATGRYPANFYWTWNPRHYASAIRTKVLYEAYPQSQDELDAILARLGLTLSVIYDP